MTAAPSDRAPAIVLANGHYQSSYAKTAHGLVRGSARYRVLGVVDPSAAGRDAGELLDGVRRGIPISASVAEAVTAAAERPRFCIVGIATSGGVLPPELKQSLQEAIEQNMSLVSGLHDQLAADRALVAAARARGVELIDIRRPRAFGELHFWSGRILSVQTPRLAVLGTDCALGKRTTARLLVEACRDAGMRAEMIYTGQTGWMQGARYGVILDAIPNDFVSGELEHALLECHDHARPDVMIIEGQSALRNPSGPCGAELLLSAGARSVILQHAPGRTYFDGLEEHEVNIPSLADELALIRLYGARTLAIALNSQGIQPGERAPIRTRLEQEHGIPAVWPLEEGVARLVPLVRALCEGQPGAN
jgi:uncharacterized NAD-dependent epimerase/dehydratase family protein